ncbi:hypothetical protein B0H14DRAFT_3149088 [Mycena olivaceomarginata]|nr:hypothetical protein B0H14DRAFT_3149088 [Mycena olivaceomarginata]
MHEHRGYLSTIRLSDYWTYSQFIPRLGLATWDAAARRSSPRSGDLHHGLDSTDSQLAEMIYGSGLLENLAGTMDSLASLVMTYLVHYRQLARDLKFLVRCLVRFLLGTRDGVQGGSLSALRKQLFETLRNKECAPACVAVVRILLGHDRQNISVATVDVLGDVKGVYQSQEFKALGVFDDWATFIDRAEQRVGLMQRLPHLQSLKALLDCGLEPWWTSRSLWFAHTIGYGHLESIADCALNYLGYRERQFIRALVLEDYVAIIRSIYEQQAALMTRGDELILTIFDPFRLSVQSIADSPIAKALEHAGDE